LLHIIIEADKCHLEAGMNSLYVLEAILAFSLGAGMVMDNLVLEILTIELLLL